MKKNIVIIFIALMLGVSLTVVAKNYTSNVFSQNTESKTEFADETTGESVDDGNVNEETKVDVTEVSNKQDNNDTDTKPQEKKQLDNAKDSNSSEKPVNNEKINGEESAQQDSAQENSVHEEGNTQESPKEEQVEEIAKVEKVTIQIVDDINKKTIASATIEKTDDNVGGITLDFLKEKGIDNRCVGGYFRSINGLAERESGPFSGWCYFVNGSKPSIGAFNYKVKAGDRIEWKYVEDGIN